MFPGTSNQTYTFNKTYTIPSEGVYSTYFLFGKHHDVEASADSESPDDEIFSDLGDLIDDIFGEDDPTRSPNATSSNHNRRALKPA